MRWLALMLAVAACGDNLADPATPRSGTRLKLGWYVYEGGARELERDWYYDKALEERCTPAAWSDGQRYCKPATDGAVFVNENCTRALGRALHDVAPAAFFATTFHLHDTALPSRVFRRGPAAMVPTAIWERHDSGCVGPRPAGGYDYFELGTEITGLVRVRRSEPRGDGALGLVYELGDDGLHVPVAFYDHVIAGTCSTAVRPNSATAECAPDDAAPVSYFQEGQCLDPLIAVSGDEVPAIAKRFDPTSRCWQYHEVGDEITAGRLYQAISDTCVQVSLPDGARLYSTLGPYAPQQLVREREATSERLARIDLVHDTVRMQDPLLFDRQLEAECRHDDELHCAPVADAEVMPFYSDPACATALDLALVPTGGCEPPRAFARKGDEVHRLAARYEDRIYRVSTAEACVRFEPSTPFVAWTIGPATDPATFATAKLVIDP